MQEHIEWLKKEKDEHGYEKHPYFECAIEHAESMLEKEKEAIMDAVSSCDAIFEEASKYEEAVKMIERLNKNVDI